MLCQSTQNAVFGGYSDIGIDSVGGWRMSANSYLFSLKDIAMKFEIKKDQKQFAIYFNDKYGIVFGKNDLKIDFTDIQKS